MSDSPPDLAQLAQSIKDWGRELGFQQVGLMPAVGTKFGRWLDLAFLQLVLDRRASPDDSAG